MTTDNPKPTTSSAWDDIKRMADEVKLKLHLASMEAKEQWKKLEPKMNELETKAKAGGEKAYGVVGQQVEAFAAGLRQFAEELHESVRTKAPTATPDEPTADMPAPSTDASAAPAPTSETEPKKD